jgi:hypothetical protein
MCLLRLVVLVCLGLGFGFRLFRLGFIALPSVLGALGLLHLGLGLLVLSVLLAYRRVLLSSPSPP